MYYISCHHQNCIILYHNYKYYYEDLYLCNCQILNYLLIKQFSISISVNCQNENYINGNNKSV